MTELAIGTESTDVKYEVGHVYKLKLDNSYYRVTLISVDYSQNPPMAHVIIREHSVDSFIGDSNIRRRHTKHSEVVPCADVPLYDLWL